MKHFKSTFLAFFIVSLTMLFSCQTDDDYAQTSKPTIPFDFQSFTTNGKKLAEEHPNVSTKISHLNDLSLRKSGQSPLVRLDTANIKVIKTVDATSYIFRIDDSVSTSTLKNYVLVRLRDSIWHQYMVDYQLDAHRQVIISQIVIAPVYGDDIFNQVTLKCGGSSFQSVWVDGYTINHPCTGDGHIASDGQYSTSNPNGCQLWGTAGGPTVTVVFGHFETQLVAQQPCADISSGASSGGGGGGVPNNNPPLDNNPDDPENPDNPNEVINIGIVPNIGTPLVETPESIKINRIATTLTSLTSDQLNYLRSPSNQYVTNAIGDYIEINPYLTQEDRTALLNTIDILRGTSPVDVLTTIESHEIFTEITAQSIENIDPIFFTGLANIYGSLNVHNNLDLSDRTSISIRTFENYGIVKVIKDANPTLVRWTELLFDFNQGKRFASNHYFVTTLSNIKKIIADNAPKTQEEWRALFSIMQPLLIEAAVSFLPGGSIALDLNTLSTQLNNANPDYTDVTLAVAGILTEFVPWTKLSKALVKVFNTTKRSFLIFNRTKKYLNKIVSIFRGGNKIHVDDANRIFIRADNTGTINLDLDLVEMETDALRVIENAGKNFISPKDINRLTEVVPTNLGFINASQIRNNAVKIKLENPADAATVQLIKNGQDTQGHLSEDLFYAAMTGDGFTAIPRSDLGAFGDQGFDNVLIKRNASGNITDVVINESKQFRSDGSIKLNDGIQGTGNSSCSGCTQMTDDWIDDVLERMSRTSNLNTVSLGAEIDAFRQTNIITRSVSAVDRATGELVIVKL